VYAPSGVSPRVTDRLRLYPLWPYFRFWNAFQKAREVRKSESSTLNPFYGKIR
jgi:hypothetical protein